MVAIKNSGIVKSIIIKAMLFVLIKRTISQIAKNKIKQFETH
jgi:hypothetical protein